MFNGGQLPQVLDALKAPSQGSSPFGMGQMGQGGQGMGSMYPSATPGTLQGAGNPYQQASPPSPWSQSMAPSITGTNPASMGEMYMPTAGY